ncbi:MAG: M56 family metallopeptidase [Pyrinomonadaceae bacterium]
MEKISQLLLTFVLNACWQVVLVASVALLCARLLRGTAARQQHLLWVAALLLSVCLPVFSTLANRTTNDADALLQQLPVNQRVGLTPRALPAQPAGQFESPAATADSQLRLTKRQAVFLLVPYCLFLLYRTAKLLNAWRKTRALVGGAQPAHIPAHVRALIEQYRQALAGGKVELLCSQAVAVPVTVGVRRARIVVPESLLQESDAEVWAAAVGHELAHIRRRDYVCNLFYELLQLPLSFHPALVLVRRRISETRELACDELVTERLLGAHAYARSLMHLASAIPALSRHPTTTTLGINGANILEERIMTLLGRRPQLSLRRKKLLCLTVATTLVVACIAATTFALEIGFDRWDTAAASVGQEQRSEAARTEAQEVEVRKKREMEERQMKRRSGEEPTLSPAEREERAKKEEVEREMRARTAKEVKLSMAQAIQLATNYQAGTVIESNLMRLKDQPAYRVMILSGDWPDTTITLVVVSAVDGQLLKTETGREHKQP